ncbi:hypothetical protein [Pseudomonas gingeri]|uniref:hypothetical protein n=1 Tax=Pseudomonas gingeri TaxID=117681 RepID=UPI0015A4B5AA|nr:hypothetical protein [Pseudomonas gingeri]NWA11568.1 hypothetical protein [Pseudomonas gingeri]
MDDVEKNPSWVTRGKTIRELIKELQTFDDLDIPVEISVDGGDTQKPISLVIRSDGVCVLLNCEE